MSTNVFNIDDHTPVYPHRIVLPKSPSQVQRKQYARSNRIYIREHTLNPAIGVKPEHLIDWRKLEKRTHELERLQHRANEAFWNTTKEIRIAHNLKGEHEEPLHIFYTRDSIITVYDNGYTHASPEHLINDHIEGKGDERFVVVGYENGGKYIGYLFHRRERLFKAWKTYLNTLHKALSDRIQEFITRERNDSKLEATFIIENEGRKYVAHKRYEDYHVQWLGGDVYGQSCAR